MRQRLHIARGLLHRPDVLFLDEPSIGIDPVGARELRTTVAQLVETGTTVLLTTHYMFEADELCDRIAVIADGQVVAQGTPDELKQGVAGGHVIEVEVFGDATPALAGVRELRGVESVAVEVRGQAQVLVVHTDVGAEVASDVLGRLSERTAPGPGGDPRADPGGRLHRPGDHPVRIVRLITLGWWWQLKMRSRSAFDGALSVIYPLFFATTVFLIYRQGADADALVAAAVGASVMGVWSAVSTTAATSLAQERRQGTLELLVASPTPLPLVVVPMTLSMATIGLYSLVATIVWGRVAFGIHVSFAHPAAFVAACVVTAVGVSVIGFVLAVTAVRYRAAWALGTAFELPVWLICGFLVPLSLLPAWVHPVSWLLPMTWGVSAVKEAAAGGTPWPDTLCCLAVSAVYAGIGAVLARRLVDSARTHATLALL
jgi:ABC-2 type transport system permease protein